MLAFPSSVWDPQARSCAKSPQKSRFGRSASLILPRLYLSDLFTARQESILSELGITHVISAIEYAPNLPKSIPNERRLHVNIADRADANLLQHFEETTEFIRKALSESAENRVLVHCFQGISRSAIIVCAYVVATSDRKMTGSEAVSFVRSKRSIVCPNIGFRTQLDIYAGGFFRMKSSQKAGKTALRREFLGTIVMERIRQLRAAQTQSNKVP